MKQLIARGFTIVELAVVIVVISILVSIVYVSYTKSLKDTAVTVLEEDLRQARDQLELNRSHGKPYPATLAQADLSKSEDTTFYYQKNGDAFCLSAASEKHVDIGQFRITSESSSVKEGGC